MTAATELDVVAERKFLIAGSAAELIVQIGRPLAGADDSIDFACPFLVRGIEPERVRWAHGVDSLQALQVALQMAAVLVLHSVPARSGALRWLDDDNRDLGLRDDSLDGPQE